MKLLAFFLTTPLAFTGVAQSQPIGGEQPLLRELAGQVSADRERKPAGLWQSVR